jgi:hypothetical protein
MLIKLDENLSDAHTEFSDKWGTSAIASPLKGFLVQQMKLSGNKSVRNNAFLSRLI